MFRKIFMGFLVLVGVVAVLAWVVLRSDEDLNATLTAVPQAGLVEEDFLSRTDDGGNEVLNYSLQTTHGLTPVRVMVSEGQAHGGDGVFIVENGNSGPLTNDDGTMALVQGSAMQNGVIAVQVNSTVSPNASILTQAISRAFIGICFHVAGDGEHFECFYLRPENGNAEDETRRQHAVQYVASPGWDFQTFRDTAPEKYENPADISPGEWIDMRIEIDGESGKLFINGADEPALEVNDLKLGGQVTGDVALWVGPGTYGFFRNLQITKTE